MTKKRMTKSPKAKREEEKAGDYITNLYDKILSKKKNNLSNDN